MIWVRPTFFKPLEPLLPADQRATAIEAINDVAYYDRWHCRYIHYNVFEYVWLLNLEPIADPNSDT